MRGASSLYADCGGGVSGGPTTATALPFKSVNDSGHSARPETVSIVSNSRGSSTVKELGVEEPQLQSDVNAPKGQDSFWLEPFLFGDFVAQEDCPVGESDCAPLQFGQPGVVPVFTGDEFRSVFAVWLQQLPT